MIFMKNSRKGNVPIILLFIVALILVITALLNFLSFSGSFELQSRQIADIMSRVEFGKSYVYSIAEISGKEAILTREDFRGKFKDIVDNRDFRIGETGNFFGIVRNGEFKFEKSNEKYILEIDGLFVQIEKGANKVRRNFHIIMEFDDKGEVLRST